VADGARRLLTIAIGGNAMQSDGEGTGAQEWFSALERSLPPLVDIVRAGHDLVLTHGNGPQVGDELLRMETSSLFVAALSLDLCVAETAGSIGYAIQQVLGNLLRAAGIDRQVVAVATQVIVSGDDPDFARPSKPVGPFYTRTQAERLASQHGWQTVEDSGRGWRRVVPSPRPLRVLEAATIRALVASGAIPIAVGGGGIPVVETPSGLRGVEAVIEKDLATGALAAALGADVVFFLTGVERVVSGFGGPAPRPLDRLTVSEARRLLDAGEFPKGSMGPKVEAAMRFVEGGGERAVITSLDQVAAALDGRTGTHVVRDA
jgi:carbamate kinase